MRQQRLLSFQADDEEMGAPTHQLPPRWVDALEELHDDLAHIKERMGQLQKVQQRRLLQLFYRCDMKLQKLCPAGGTAAAAAAAAAAGSAADTRMQQNAQKAVAAQLHSLNQAFRQQQKAYLEEIRRRVHEDDLLPNARDSTAPSLSAQRDFSGDLMADLEVIECDTEARREEIAKVAQSMVELHQLFKDSATLVVEQGTLLDRIDYNLEQVAQQSADATNEIKKAEESRRSGLAAKCIFFLSMTIIVLLVLLIIKHT
ncbi:syntaxin, putative [Eimeria mitis]|uniref:Syntaxin, putative n=1 Tax=Eimeria mitis TaxID=44415 RepID=U6JQG6_9EIME|nr:syntaxin, putative [Eimeria mitis]CDJ27735.1 syntaxin, putative [Eimeria mitis]